LRCIGNYLKSKMEGAQSAEVQNPVDAVPSMWITITPAVPERKHAGSVFVDFFAHGATKVRDTSRILQH